MPVYQPQSTPYVEVTDELEPQQYHTGSDDGYSSGDGWDEDELDDSVTTSSSKVNSTDTWLPTRRLLHLRLQKSSARTTLCEVLFGRVDGAMTVVLVQLAQKGRLASMADTTSTVCSGIRQVLRLSGLCDYIDVRARDHVNMKYYISRFPGLVHFIFVDRRANEASNSALLAMCPTCANTLSVVLAVLCSAGSWLGNVGVG